MARPIPASDETVQRVRELIQRRGVGSTARVLQLAEATTARLAGGLPVHPGTAELARMRLDLLLGRGGSSR